MTTVFVASFASDMYEPHTHVAVRSNLDAAVAAVLAHVSAWTAGHDEEIRIEEWAVDGELLHEYDVTRAGEVGELSVP